MLMIFLKGIFLSFEGKFEVMQIKFQNNDTFPNMFFTGIRCGFRKRVAGLAPI